MRISKSKRLWLASFIALLIIIVSSLTIVFVLWSLAASGEYARFIFVVAIISMIYMAIF